MTRNRAFTLIELLVVILIMALLISISIMVGKTVIGGGRTDQTQNVLRSLDVLLNDVISRDGMPDPYIEDPHNPGVFMPIIDGRNMAIDETETSNPGFQMINSVGLFMFQLGQSESSADALEGIDAKFRRMYTPYAEENPNGVHEIPTIFDAWDNPIRYVHPAWDSRFWGDDLDDMDATSPSEPSEFPMLSDALNVFLPQGGTWAIESVRRNSMVTIREADTDYADELADSDGGISPNQHPYFYSAGPDGKVGFDDVNENRKLDPGETDYNADNVYTIKPLFKD